MSPSITELNRDLIEETSYFEDTYYNTNLKDKFEVKVDHLFGEVP